MNMFFPMFFRIEERPCLVVGGGEVAARKVDQLLKAKAEVHVVAPDLCEKLSNLSKNGTIQHDNSIFSEDLLTKYVLIIAATNDSKVNLTVSKFANNHNIPINVVDAPELCMFIMPSVIDRGPVQVAISTGGASPVLARLLRARLESVIPSAYGRLAELMSLFREQAKSHFPEMRHRHRFWENIVQGPIAELLFSGQEQAAKDALAREFSEPGRGVDKCGEVYLVGGGPGDPDLLTFRALRLMQQAEVVLYDRLVASAIVDLVRKDAERIYVGKESDKHTVPQEEIIQLLIKLAKEGKRVLRLKGGDPFIFGRGGEEIESLAAEGVPFQVVPGITAAAGCSSYAGIPLTHRDYAQACVFVTGHMKDGELSLNWDMLARPNQTIVVYMGLQGVEALVTNLLKQGMSAEMPVAIVQQGTTPEQRVVIATLGTLKNVAESEDIQPPSMLIIGKVVNLHEQLAWHETVTTEME